MLRTRSAATLVRTLAVPALLALAAPAHAGDIVVSPILVELSTRTPSVVLNVRNDGAAPVRMQLRAYAWSQDVHGEMTLAPTAALVVFPPLLELAPGASRNVRIGTTAVPGPAEQPFRIFVEELPPPSVQPQQTGVQILTRIGIPVFVEPQHPRAALQATAAAEGRHVRFTLRNTGTIRVRPTAVRIAVLGEDGRALEAREEKTWYVLSGDAREYDLELAPERCAAARHVELTAVLDRESVTASAPVSPDACRP